MKGLPAEESAGRLFSPPSAQGAAPDRGCFFVDFFLLLCLTHIVFLGKEFYNIFQHFQPYTISRRQHGTMKKRFLSLLLALGLTLGLAAPALAARDTPSAWAADAVTWLQGTGKLTNSDFAGYDRTVTRADFARLGVVLYELITGMPKPDPSDVKNPFTDTDDLDVLRAYKIKLVSGTGNGTTFSPNDSVNREQIAVMLLRVLDACGVTYSQASTTAVKFSDEADLSSWAAESVKRAYLIQIMNGTGGTSMSPKMTVTMEQAYQLLYNVYTNRDAIRGGAVRAISAGAMGTLSVKYTGGGKYDTGWCEDAYHCQPVLCDVDKDGTQEILAASYTVQCLDAATGALKWRFPAGADRSTATDGTNLSYRTWPNLYVGDVDGDGKNEIVAGHGSSILHKGTVAVYDENGYFKPGWPQTLPDEVYSIAVDDLDGDGTLEIAAGIGVADGLSVYVYEHDGSIRRGWPQLSASADGNKTLVLPDSDPKAPSLGYSYGVFNDNIAIGDINGDGKKEIVVPADMGQICAYKPDGSQVRSAFQMEIGKKNYGVTESVVWGRVGTFSDADYESKVYNGGFGRQNDLMGNPLAISSLPMNERLTAHFTHSKAVIADLDGNGKNEVVVVGDIHDRADEAAANAGADLPHLYQELFIFNGDRTRFNSAWAKAPTVKEAPLCPLTNSDWLTINRCMPDPVCADVDGDGKLEILYPDFSGKLNCYWLDHTQHGSWPINVYDGAAIEYATAPAVADLNGDGKAEIVFTTFTQKNGTKRGSLYIADGQGKVLQHIELPVTTDTSNAVPNGCTASPVLGDVDGDGKLEIILHTSLSGVTVYDLD